MPVQSWLVSMETNQPPHLVTLTHSTRRIADGGSGRMRKHREKERERERESERMENNGEEARRKTDKREGREFCG